MEEELSMTDSEGMRDKLARSSEDALGKLAQDLLENPLVNGAISRAFGARGRAVQAQEAAMGALNIPSAADLERLTRRLRSVSQRLEGIEDGVDRLDERLAEGGPAPRRVEAPGGRGGGGAPPAAGGPAWDHTGAGLDPPAAPGGAAGAPPRLEQRLHGV